MKGEQKLDKKSFKINKSLIKLKAILLLFLLVIISSDSGLVRSFGDNVKAQYLQEETLFQSDENLVQASTKIKGQEQSTFSLYLPVAVKNPCTLNHPMLLSVYAQQWLGSQETIEDEIKPLDKWADKRLSIIGTYIDIEVANPEIYIRKELDTMWENGYTPFINLPTTRSAYQVAIGNVDEALINWAKAYKTYAQEGDGRMAFIAPLQEMNGYWVPYGLNPYNFKAAYWHIQKVFSEAGIPSNSIQWVFAPNGYNDPSDSQFEAYYPGDVSVDVVAFSSYNYGYHPNNSWPRWETAQEIYLPYLDRMRKMAPTKPIIIAQTGTTAYYSDGYNVAAKDQWFRDGFTFLSDYPGLLGIIYENSVNEQGYDWPFFINGNVEQQFQGYVDGVSDHDICYISPGKLKELDLFELTVE